MQSTVYEFMAFGVPGELYTNSPWRGQPVVIDSVGPNTIGFACSLVPGTATVDGVPAHVNIGGALGAIFAGIIANPKEYGLFGTTTGPLTPTLNLPQYATAAAFTMGQIVVEVSGAVNVGDTCDYDQTTGALQARTPSFIPAAGTTAVASSVLTIASITAGSPLIGVGSRVPTLHGYATVVTVSTGTGGNGTYAIAGGIADSSATAITTPIFTAAPSGKNNIPGSEFVQYGEAASGLCVLQLH